jgi:hypothetical protein
LHQLTATGMELSRVISMNVRIRNAMTALACLAAAGMAHASTTVTPGRPALTMAVQSFLQSHGDLCVGKFTWPRIVTEADREAGTNDAQQLPVLERLGLVKAEVLPAGGRSVSGAATRYSLTPRGLQFYLHKERTVLGIHGQAVEHDADFCVARLSLDKVVRWTQPEQMHGHVETQVLYTYRIDSADWMADPRARKVFPVVDRIIRGQGNMLMSVTVQAQNGTWVPVLPGQ